jgi:hypothetical protein
MSRRTIAAGALLVALTALTGQALQAQMPAHLRDYPLAPLKASGDLIAPFFDGWYDNGDGTITYQFGFLNRNTEEIVDIPLGENNRITPAQYDGIQPTHFPVYNRRGLTGKRERGVFAVTVPSKETEVVWTLTHAGHTYSIPGRAKSVAYEMSRFPAAFGSLPPAIRFSPTGQESRGTEGPMAERVMASVGTPVTLTALVQDRGQRYGLSEQEWYPVRAEFLWHQGPADIEFEPATVTVDPDHGSAGEGAAAGASWGRVSTEATFSQPGDYVVRIRVDNFGAHDSRFDNMCCWANAYVPVTVR